MCSFIFLVRIRLTIVYDCPARGIWLRRKRVIQKVDPARFAATFPGFTAQDLPLTVRDRLRVADLETTVSMRGKTYLAAQLERMTTQLGETRYQLETTIEEWAELDAELEERNNALKKQNNTLEKHVTSRIALEQEVLKLKGKLVEKNVQLEEKNTAILSKDKEIAGLMAKLKVRQHPFQLPHRSVLLSMPNATTHKSSTPISDKVVGTPTKKRARVGDD